MFRISLLVILASCMTAALPTALPEGANEPQRVLIRLREEFLPRQWQSLLDLAHVHPCIEGLNPSKVVLIPHIDVLVETLSGQPDVPAALSQLANDPAVEFAERDGRVEAHWTPDDPGLPLQWGLSNIRAFTAWDVWRGRNDFIIAVLDTGIDYSHPDTAAKYVGGMDFVNYDSDPWDDHGHGTHVAGIASAVTNNSLGMAGVCPDAGLLAVKVLDGAGYGWWSDAASGIVWATDNGCHVINMSFGGSGYSTAMELACQYAWDRGVVLVASAGNSYGTYPQYPAYYAPVIATAANGQNDQKASFSTYGSWVELSAPGLDIWSCLPIWRGSFGFLSGTSMASPHVAGAAALLYSRLAGGPGDRTVANAIQVRAAIERTADPVWFVRHGRLNLDSALRNSKLAVTVAAVDASGTVGGGTLLSARLSRVSDGAPVIGRTLRFFVGETEVGLGTTDSTGFVGVPFDMSESLGAGTHTYEARFLGDGSYLPAEDEATLTVSKAPTSLYVPPSSAQVGATITLVATLYRSTDSSVLPNREVSFSVNGLDAGKAMTNLSGVAAVQFYVPDTLGPGSEVVTATFSGDDNHNSCGNNGLLYVSQAPTIVSAANASGAPGEPVRLMAVLRRSTDGALVQNRWLEFSIDGQQVGQARTNAHGFAALGWIIPSEYPTGTATISVLFGGDPLHMGTAGTAILQVIPPQESVRLDLWMIGSSVTDAVTASGVELRSTLAQTPVATLESQLGGRPGDLLSGAGHNFYAGFWSAIRCSPVVIHGHVWLAAYDAIPAAVPLSLQVSKDGEVVSSLEGHLDAAGNYSFSTWLTGTYDLVAKPSHWLSVKHSAVPLCGDTVQDWVFAYNGDTNGDNAVNLLDLNAILLSFGTGAGPADLNGDGSTDLMDLNIVLLNFGRNGQT